MKEEPSNLSEHFLNLSQAGPTSGGLRGYIVPFFFFFWSSPNFVEKIGLNFNEGLFF